MFRRRKRAEAQPSEPEEFVDDLDAEDRAYEDALLLAEIEEQERTETRRALRPSGPWDVDDVPDDDLPRLDLGALRVPVPPDTEVRVEVSPEGEVVAATFVHGEAAMQIGVFAAPRTEGIWDEVRAEIAESLTASGGSAEEAEGPYGAELHAAVPTEVPGQGVLLAPARFVGVDGPRWFLRALFTGAAAVDRDAAGPLEEALRDVVVVRGTQPMAVRDPLPLRLPPDVQQAAGDDEDADDDPGGALDEDGDEAVGPAGEQRDPLALPVRGPEITETR